MALSDMDAAIMQQVLIYCLDNNNMTMYMTEIKEEKKTEVCDGATFRYELLFGPTERLVRDYSILKNADPNVKPNLTSNEYFKLIYDLTGSSGPLPTGLKRMETMLSVGKELLNQ